MANLPTSLNIQQPNISDGSDLLRMAALLSKESSETADKAFTDFKSTMRTSANNDLASTFANGIANGLSPDEAFKQASGTINSWTSADAINAALQTRNAEKEAIIRENMDRRAEAAENREKLDWEGANKAAEANNLFNLAHATNNMNLFKQAEALTQGYDDITKKHVKPTEMATLQDSLATNAVSRARAGAEIKKINDELLAKRFQAMYLQDRANNPDKSTLSSLARVASALGFNSAEEGQLFALANGLGAGTETIDERTKANTNARNFTHTDQASLNFYKEKEEIYKMDAKKLNSLLGDTSKLTEQQKEDREGLINSLVPQVVEATEGILSHPGGSVLGGMNMGPSEKISPEQAKDFIQKYLQAPDATARKKVVTDFRSTLKGLVPPNRLNDLLNTNFTENPNGFLSFTPEASKTYLDAINSQDINGVRRDEVASRNSLKAEEFELQKESAEISKLEAEAQTLYFKGGKDAIAKAQQLTAKIKARKETLSQRAKDHINRYVMTYKGPSIATIYKNYAPIITGDTGFDLSSLEKAFGKDKAETLMKTYADTIKELKNRPGITIPDEAIRAAILTNPDETDEDDIIEIATLIKSELLALTNYVNTSKKVQKANDNVTDTTLTGLAKRSL